MFFKIILTHVYACYYIQTTVLYPSIICHFGGLGCWVAGQTEFNLHFGLNSLPAGQSNRAAQAIKPQGGATDRLRCEVVRLAAWGETWCCGVPWAEGSNCWRILARTTSWSSPVISVIYWYKIVAW